MVEFVSRAAGTTMQPQDPEPELDLRCRCWLHVRVHRAVRVEGAFTPGASFTWTSYGFTVTSTIYEVHDGSRVLWGGTADGITGVHEWIFRETPTGVRVETNESFAGDPVQADAGTMQTMLDTSLSSWLAHLKVSAEARA